MSKSYRKHAFTALSKAESDKQGKTLCHKKFRRKESATVKSALTVGNFDEVVFPECHDEVLSEFAFDKDGKIYIGHDAEKSKYMRK